MKQKIYIDESGNNGIIKYDYVNKKFNYNQRYFALCLFIPNKEESYYINEYINLKKKYNINILQELKGSELMTKRNNDILKDFIDIFMNDKDFYITLYDKKFLTAAHFVYNVFGPQHRERDPYLHFAFIELFVNQNDAFFEPFFLMCENPTIENAKALLNYLINYKYEYVIQIEMILPLLKVILERYLSNDKMLALITEEFEGYIEDSIMNINMTALGESILVLKDNRPEIKNKDLEIYHDNSLIISDIIYDLIPNMNISFIDSGENIMVQIADNVVSIFNKLQTEILNENYKKLDNIKDLWHFKQFCTVSKRITPYNIKYCLDFTTASYMRTWAYYEENMTNLEYVLILNRVCRESYKALGEINFDVVEGFNKLNE